MYSMERFREIEEAFRSIERGFESDRPNDVMARTLLITTQELARIHREFKNEYGNEAGARHQYQDVFFTRGLHSLFALYWLLQRYRFDAARREMRFQLETYFVIRGLNRDKEVAADIYTSYRDELKELGLEELEEVALHESEAVDRLHGIRREEMNRAEEVWPEVQEYYNLVSNTSSHPVRMWGAWNEGSRSSADEESLLKWGLYLAYGLTRELLKTYLDTSASEFIERESQPIVEQFDEVLGEDVPTFLLDEY